MLQIQKDLIERFKEKRLNESPDAEVYGPYKAGFNEANRNVLLLGFDWGIVDYALIWHNGKHDIEEIHTDETGRAYIEIDGNRLYMNEFLEINL